MTRVVIKSFWVHAVWMMISCDCEWWRHGNWQPWYKSIRWTGIVSGIVLPFVSGSRHRHKLLIKSPSSAPVLYARPVVYIFYDPLGPLDRATEEFILGNLLGNGGVLHRSKPLAVFLMTSQIMYIPNAFSSALLPAKLRFRAPLRFDGPCSDLRAGVKSRSKVLRIPCSQSSTGLQQHQQNQASTMSTQLTILRQTQNSSPTNSIFKMRRRTCIDHQKNFLWIINLSSAHSQVDIALWITCSADYYIYMSHRPGKSPGADRYFGVMLFFVTTPQHWLKCWTNSQDLEQSRNYSWDTIFFLLWPRWPRMEPCGSLQPISPYIRVFRLTRYW